MKTNPVKVHLHVDTSVRGRVLATVVVDNVSDHVLRILKEPPGFFVVCEGQEVADIGPSDKRRAPGPADYEQVPPGKSATRQADLSAQFAWRPGRHVYTLQTGGGYDDPLAGERFDAPLATTEFTLTR